MAPPTKDKSSTRSRSRAKDSDSNGNGNGNTKGDDLNRDKEGNLIDPPIIPEFEQRITAASNSGDDLLIADVQAEYDDARVKLAREQADRERRRQEASE